MATSNPGPGVSANPNEMQLRSTYDINGKLLQILGPGQTVAFDPANVAITGGTVNGASLQGSVPFNPANVAITGGTINGAPLQSVANSQRSVARGLAVQGLRRFRAALSARNTAPVDIVHIGDSITWGYKAGLLSQRWGAVVRDTLRQRFPNQTPVVGGAGFISCRQDFGAVTFTDAQAVRTGGSDASSNFGPDQNGYVLSAAGQKIVYTFTGTGFDIFYAQFGGGGTVSYKVDAGTLTNIVTAGANVFASRNQAIRGLAAGVHTVEVAWVSGTSYVTGGFAYNGDESVGIRSWILAWPSTASGYWWDTTKNYWLQHFNAINPVLVTIELGPNDYAGVSPVAIATFKANVTSIIADIKSRCAVSPSFVLCPTWPLTPAGTPLALWSLYVSAMYEIAQADIDLAVCVDDWQDRTSSIAGTTIGGLLDADFTHPNPTGNRYLGETQASFLAS